MLVLVSEVAVVCLPSNIHTSHVVNWLLLVLTQAPVLVIIIILHLGLVPCLRSVTTEVSLVVVTALVLLAISEARPRNASLMVLNICHLVNLIRLVLEYF